MAELDTKAGLEQAWGIIEERGLRPLFAGVKGSVVYELPGTHVDLDVRVVYRAKTADILSLNPPRPIVEVMEGELDLVGWEVGKFLAMLLNNNGNMVELTQTPEHLTRASRSGEPLREMGSHFLTRRLGDYYKGYAYSQFKRAQHQIRTGKGILYTYREMYAGIWLMRTGRIVFPWDELRGLIEGEGIYKSELLDGIVMDRAHVPDEAVMAARREFDELTAIFDAEVAASDLPKRYPAGYDVCNAYLLRLRSKGWL